MTELLQAVLVATISTWFSLLAVVIPGMLVLAFKRRFGKRRPQSQRLGRSVECLRRCRLPCGGFQCLDRLPCVDNDPRLDRPDEPEGTPGAERPLQPPPDRPGSPGQPSRAESRAEARETDKPLESTETDGKSETAEPGRESEQKPTEPESPLERMPSHSGFANLAEEFDARRASREAAQGNGAANEQPSETGKPDLRTAELDDDAIKEQIDPFAPDLSKTEGRKEAFEQTVREADADWTDGVDCVEDLPTGEDLAEQNDNAPKADRFRRTGYENLGTIKGRLESATDAVDKALGPRPTGHAETRAEGPAMADPPHSGVDAGSAASAMLAAGIMGAEALRWVRGKINERGTDEGNR